MKLYQLTRVALDYDEYDSFIIWANTPEEALQLAVNEAGNYAYECGILEVKKPDHPQIGSSNFITNNLVAGNNMGSNYDK